jgi:formylglycine-generating enzyme required for sulfatase activity
VDWYEAVAFSRWLAAQLNQPIRLPTEQEWEKAARGTDGRQYPWGHDYINGYANVYESKLSQTTAVGMFPQGESPYGVMDMAGNVWEWCLNKGDHPEQIEPDTSGNWRVLRGGSWFLNPEFARAAYRFRCLPDLRSSHGGFRVVLSVPIF